MVRLRWSGLRALLSLGAVVALPAAWADAAQTNAPEVAERTKVKTEVVARGLEHPWALQFLPDGRLLVTERPGRLRLVTREGKIGPPIAGVPEVVASGQGGLLDVALAPDFQSSGLIYLSYSEPRGGQTNGTSVAKARLRLAGDSGRLDELEVIFQQEPAVASQHHFGSRIVFAANGDLFITLGERYRSRLEAQNPANHIGKVVRIRPDGAPSAENPKSEGWDPKVWSIGHRNIQGAVLENSTGELWTVEHGARGGDELNRPQSGKNYGWPIISYGKDYSGTTIGEGTAKAGLEQPVYYWVPSIATSGLALYTGELFRGWSGNLLVGGLAGAHIERLVLKNGEVVAKERLLDDLGRRIRDVRQGPDGAVWVLTDDGDGLIVRISPAS